MSPDFDSTPWLNPIVQHLQQAFALEPRAIAIALPYCRQDFDLLPTILWQYGLISLSQLDRMLDWLLQFSEDNPL
jgi:hypothetical protein